jgi:hypothetical protein
MRRGWAFSSRLWAGTGQLCWLVLTHNWRQQPFQPLKLDWEAENLVPRLVILRMGYEGRD